LSVFSTGTEKTGFLWFSGIARDTEKRKGALIWFIFSLHKRGGKKGGGSEMKTGPY